MSGRPTEAARPADAGCVELSDLANAARVGQARALMFVGNYRAFAAGTWLTGYRLGNIRRLLRSDGLDLYPSTQPGRDASFPVTKQELDNNPDINAACPSGSSGSWPA